MNRQFDGPLALHSPTRPGAIFCIAADLSTRYTEGNKSSTRPMKRDKYSAEAALLDQGGSRKPGSQAAGKAARISKQTGASVRALTLFSRIAEDASFSAEAAHKAFGHLKRKAA